MKRGAIPPFWSLSAAGFAATAIGFGPARMGFGLFVPEFRTAFAMSSASIGLVSSLGFLGFFCGLLVAQRQLTRRGPRPPVLTGLAAATLGLGIVAVAPSLPVLACGVFLAATSAGLAWAPFNDAVHQSVSDPDRPTALSMVSTGTGIGIAMAGVAALVVVVGDMSWRVAWVFFATAAALALAANVVSLRRVEKAPPDAAQPDAPAWTDMMALPVLAVAFAYGTTSAVYIAFAADHVVTAGGLQGIPRDTTPALIFLCYGLFGLSGLIAGRIKTLIGLSALLRMLMLSGAASVALIALWPDVWAGLVLSAALQGVHVMMTSAVLAFWTERMFPHTPSRSFTLALLASAAGSVLGPGLAGLLVDTIGAKAMFLGTGVLPAVTALALRERHARDRPARPARRAA